LEFVVATDSTMPPASDTASRVVVIANEQGLHARPAYLFAQLSETFAAKIEIEKDDQRVDGSSILSILTLGAGHGSELCIHASGEDAETAVAALAELVENGFPSPNDAEKNE